MLERFFLSVLKIEDAFAAGYDPALELAKNHSVKPTRSGEVDAIGIGSGEDEPWTQHLRRKEQDLIDSIVHGNEPGHYFMLLGPKVGPLS